MSAIFQLLSLNCFPSSISTLIPVSYLIYRALKIAADLQCMYTGVYTNVRLGRWTTEFPDSQDSSGAVKAKGIVIFVLGARINQYVSLD